MKKIVSIVLPTYNGEQFLRQSIDSCLDQSYPNIELIIVNDCSTDKTEKVIKSYDDKRIKYIKNDINQRLPRSLNIGFDNATGDYLTWTSDDNYFDTSAIEKMVTALESKSADLVYAPYQTINGNGDITGERTVGPKINILLDNVVKACFLYKKELHLTLKGYNPDLFLVEDYDFWIRAALENFKFLPLQEQLYFYRFHEKSLTERRRSEISNALLELLKKHSVIFKNAGKNEFISAELFLKLAKLSIVNSSKKESFTYLRQALSYRPQLIISKGYYKLLLKLFFLNRV